MIERLSNLLIFFGIALVIFILWVLSFIFVLRNSDRRGLPFQERAVWLVLAALFPIIGSLAYIITQGLDRYLTPHRQIEPGVQKRVTADKAPDAVRPRLGTVVAADLPHPTYRDLEPPASQVRIRERRRIPALKSVEGPLAGRSFPIHDLPARIGRGSLAAIRLDEDPGVSRQHAEIYQSAGLFHIRDLQSTHGTYLNGKTITEASLNPGDRLKMGLSTLVFTLEDEHGAP